MRQLAQPRVLISASLAALATALACYPRLSLWLNRSYPIWYLEALIFLGGIVLWGFVFAWHTQYTRRPVFILKLEPDWFITATLAGILAAIVFRLFLDPTLRPKMPENYPASLEQWLAAVLFSLAFGQLFLLFAPFAWLIRLFKNQRVAAALTVLFGVVVLMIYLRSARLAISPPLLAVLLFARICMGLLSVLFYLRGGVLLAWWWGLLLEARHLLSLTGNS